VGSILNVPVSNNQQYTLNSNYSAGGGTIVLSQDISSVVQSPGIVVVDRVDTNGGKTPTKRTYYYFTGVSSATLTGVTLADGTDQAHSVGAIAEFVPDVKWAQSIRDGLTKVVSGTTGNLDTTKVVDLTSVQTLTHKDLTDVSNTLPVGLTNTATMTNKRITKRVGTVTQAAAPAINTDNMDIAEITGLAQAITSMTTGLTGTPAKGDKLEVWITDDGTGRAITWGTSYESTANATLPITTVASTRLRIGLEWSGTKWSCLA
jgi:hypothetical protein